MTRSRVGWLTTALLPAAWVVLLVNMQRARQQAAFGLRALGLEGRGNSSADVATELAIAAIEVVFLVAVLRPWLERPLWPRAIAGFALFAPWTLLAFAIGIHAGPISEQHTMWRLSIVAIVGLTAITSGFRAIVRRAA